MTTKTLSQKSSKMRLRASRRLILSSHCSHLPTMLLKFCWILPVNAMPKTMSLVLWELDKISLTLVQSAIPKWSNEQLKQPLQPRPLFLRMFTTSVHNLVFRIQPYWSQGLCPSPCRCWQLMGECELFKNQKILSDAKRAETDGPVTRLLGKEIAWVRKKISETSTKSPLNTNGLRACWFLSIRQDVCCCTFNKSGGSCYGGSQQLRGSAEQRSRIVTD